MSSTYSRMQEAPDKVAELEAKFERLLEVVTAQQGRIIELEHDIESVSRTTAESVFEELVPNIYDALIYLNNTDAWQNATLASLQLSDEAQNATISCMQSSIRALTAEVDANSAKISATDVDVSILQTNFTTISTEIEDIDSEISVEEAQLQENTDNIAENAQQAATNAEDIQSLGSEL